MERVECHLFSGLLGVGAGQGTKELERLIDDLPPQVDAHHHPEGRWRKVLKEIVARHQDFGEAIVILIGHSYGARRCIQISDALRVKNIDVVYVAGIDPTALFMWQKPMVIPKNVGMVDEFHATSGICHTARKKDPSGNSGGRYIRPGGSDLQHEITVVTGSHIRCPASKITREKVLEQVTKLIS